MWFLGRCPQRVASVDPLSQLTHARDFDFHSFSSPGFLKSRMICSKSPLQWGSSLVAISLWLVLLLNLVVDLFAMASEQTVGLKWPILNKHNKWFHSSRVKFPLVRMSASWFLVSMYLIWIFESKLIRSNNQSSATLWVLETCLIGGLLPLIIILITASLSSITYNKASWCENLTFEGTQSILFNTLIIPWDRLFGPWLLSQFTTGCPGLSGVWIVFPRTKTIRSHKSRAGIPSNLNPASEEMISDSVELCETEVCFLHIRLIGTNVRLPKMHNVPPEVDSESSRSPAKSESWNSPSLHCLAVLPT